MVYMHTTYFRLKRHRFQCHLIQSDSYDMTKHMSFIGNAVLLSAGEYFVKVVTYKQSLQLHSWWCSYFK